MFLWECKRYSNEYDKNTFCVTVIYNEGETITQEVKKPNKEDPIEEVNMNQFDMETENTQQEEVPIEEVKEQQEEVPIEEVKEQQEEETKEEVKVQQEEEPNEEVKEQQEEEPKEEVKVQQEEEPKEKRITIEELTEILKKRIKEKKTFLTYSRTIKQVYDYFKTDDFYSLLQKEQDIINFIEDKYKTSISSISSKLCGVLMCYTVLNSKLN